MNNMVCAPDIVRWNLCRYMYRHGIEDTLWISDLRQVDLLNILSGRPIKKKHLEKVCEVLSKAGLRVIPIEGEIIMPLEMDSFIDEPVKSIDSP
jgi:hypothetical protein